MNEVMKGECYCQQQGRKINCIDQGNKTRIQIIDGDVNQINGSVGACVLRMRAAMQCGTSDLLDKFEPFSLPMKNEPYNQDIKKMIEIGLPIDQIIFTA